MSVFEMPVRMEYLEFGAYKLTLKGNNDTLSSSENDPIWSRLWKLQIPPKAKIFLWRATWDILPHGANLQRKGITNVEKRQRCGMIKTDFHVLKDCR